MSAPTVTSVRATTGRGALTIRLHPDQPYAAHVELPDGSMHLYDRVALLAALTFDLLTEETQP